MFIFRKFAAIFFYIHIATQYEENVLLFNSGIKSATSFHIVSSQSDRYRENDRALNRHVIRHSNVTLTSARATELELLRGSVTHFITWHVVTGSPYRQLHFHYTIHYTKTRLPPVIDSTMR